MATGVWAQKPATGTPVRRLIAGKEFYVRTIDRLRPSPVQSQAMLAFDYAQAVILNPTSWDSTRKDRVPYEVDLVFSAYPADTSKWLTPYQGLMAARIQALRKLDRRFDNPDIRWNMIAQTGCVSDEEARLMFHGFVVKYRIDITRGSSLEGLIEFHLQEAQRIIRGIQPPPDSIGHRVFRRKPEWKNLLVVMDWTASMYPYGAEIIAWHQKHLDKKIIRHLVLFNDGDDMLRSKNGRANDPKYVGRTGGFYDCDPDDLEDVMLNLELAMKAGDGGDTPENNLEALLYAVHKYHDYDGIVLIADNKSPVRDMALLPRLKKPVHILLCGLRNNPVNPDLLMIAWETGGSLHTVEEDLEFNAPRQPIAGDSLSLNGRVIRLKQGRFRNE